MINKITYKVESISKEGHIITLCRGFDSAKEAKKWRTEEIKRTVGNINNTVKQSKILKVWYKEMKEIVK